MSATYFIADLHFGHEKVAKIRGFGSGLYEGDGSLVKDTTADLHDHAITESWRRTVRPQDRVYVLGDISGGSSFAEERALDILGMLPGEKHLIAGNHDSVASIHRNGYKRLPRFLEVFASVRDFARIRMQKTDVLLSHYPYESWGDGPHREGTRYGQFRLPNKGAPLIHGHTHQTDPAGGRTQYCVSWDAHRALVPLSKIERHFFGNGEETKDGFVEC